MHSHKIKSLALAVREIALIAGKEILKIYESDFSIKQKYDKSPVTSADEAAEKIILEQLSMLEPRLPVLAEESFSRGNIPNIAGGPFWAVDPLDGTKEFINKNGEFTVNIALIENHKPIAGVVHAPALNNLYLALGPNTVTEEINGQKPKKIKANTVNENNLIVVASRSHRDLETEDYLSTLKISKITSAGSSLKFCSIASGNADIYPRFGTTMEWDTAAGHAILSAANGSVKTIDGKDLKYGKPGFKNPGFIAWGNRA